MQRGRKPKPTTLHLVQGTLAKKGAADKARREKEMRPAGPVGDPPAAFNDEQRAVWSRVLEDTPPGVLTCTDHDVLVNYVLLVAARDSALRLFNAAGAQPVIKGQEGFITNPFLRELKRLSEQMRMMQGELGFTPAARTRVSAGDEGGEDPLDAFLK